MKRYFGMDWRGSVRENSYIADAKVTHAVAAERKKRKAKPPLDSGRQQRKIWNNVYDVSSFSR